MRSSTVSLILVAGLCAAALSGCGKASDSATDTAAVATAPPQVDCNPQELDNARAGLSAYIASNDKCVMNRTEIATVVSWCKRDVATGKLFVRSTSTYADTFLSDTNYAIEAGGMLDPSGSPVAGAITVNPNDAWLGACKAKGILDSLSQRGAQTDSN